MDYGHQHYMNNLQNQRHITACALRNLEKRTGEELFVQQNWFQSARQRQDEEEKSRDNEKRKIKREAVLFKRYWSTLEARAKELRKKEDLKRQDDFLEEVYRERISLRENEDAAWDSIEDVVEDERATYVEIKNLFLMLKEENLCYDVQGSEKMVVSKSATTKGKAQKRVKTESGDRPGVETKSQMRKRLKDGTFYRRAPAYSFAEPLIIR